MIELHPLCTLFPRIQGAEFDALVEDIRANGQREPIILHEGLILDGGNRYRACLEAGIEPQCMEFGGGNLVAYVLSANLHRRHMTTGQRAAIVASAQDWAKAQTVGKPKSGNLTGLDTVASRQAQSGVSDKTQRDADKVAKANPELAQKVAHGEISLPDAVAQVTGKRPGAKPKTAPKAEEPAPELVGYNPDDPATIIMEMAHALEQSEKDVRRLEALVKSLQAGDREAEIAKLHERIAGLEGGLQQETGQKNEAIRSAKWWRTQAEKHGYKHRAAA